MENEFDIIEPEGSKLTYIRKGILKIDDEPVYIVDHIEETGLSYVMVYAVNSPKEEPLRKAGSLVQEPLAIPPNSPILMRMLKNVTTKKNKKWVTHPPLFTAPVVANYTCSITGKKESGFFEREPDRESTEFGKRKLIRGRNTGVFIGMSAVSWEDKWTIPTKSIVDALVKHKNMSNFYDLTGNNQDKSNPLSSVYNPEEN
ncbi:hypothetical protein 015DV002_101 [Bacillus phage 015DV002]|nr:hypothetical protein 015DV002_101 [Bacillus phage 015DV002]QQO41333.1 hypothetical protein 015DV004_118 [Bacillus phage 015DV004]